MWKERIIKMIWKGLLMFIVTSTHSLLPTVPHAPLPLITIPQGQYRHECSDSLYQFLFTHRGVCVCGSSSSRTERNGSIGWCARTKQEQGYERGDLPFGWMH